MTTTTLPLSARLKADTQDLHTQAERHAMQHALVSGRARAADYAAYLAQMYWAHHSLEKWLRAAAAVDDSLAALVREHHYRLPQLENDLRFLGLGGPAGVAPSRATSRFGAWVGHVAGAQPAALIGVLYVLEGSTNGGRFIARALRRGLGFADGRGTEYLDPHGEAQAERWGSFKAGLDALPLGVATQEAVIEAARATFSAIIEIMDELPEAVAAASEPSGALR